MMKTQEMKNNIKNNIKNKKWENIRNDKNKIK